MTMLTATDRLFSLIAPHICKGCGEVGNSLCSRCIINMLNNTHPICVMCGKTAKRGNLCDSCRRHNKLFNDIISIGPREGALKSLVGDYKYFSEVECCKPISTLLRARLTDYRHTKLVFVPIPTVPSHIRERGFDHMLLVAKELSKLFDDARTDNSLLYRTDNLSQHEQNSADRRTKIKKSIMPNKLAKIDPTATYVVLDDIWTTGSTAKRAGEALKELGAKNIICAVAAYQPKI